MSTKFIRVGGTVINLDSVASVNLRYGRKDESKVRVTLRVTEGEGQGELCSLSYYFEGEEADCVRGFFILNSESLTD